VSKSWKDRGVDKFTSKQNRNIKVKRNRQEWNDDNENESDDYQPRNTEPVESDTPEAAHR
jgi:hypothetical protein